jgi:hypothetical protein
MSKNNGSVQFLADGSPSALDDRSRRDATMITPGERKTVLKLGTRFAEQADGIWLLISGGFVSDSGRNDTDSIVKDLLRRAFGYPKPEESTLVLNVLLDSPGGSLDSAYATALYLKAYAKKLRVHVPGRAKSASTLLAIGADELHLSAFGELGPLDTQIPDPRNPANTVSALDCYQSVDYVRDFGFDTITSALPRLVESTERRIPVSELLDMASRFAIGAIKPVLSTITALDFGGWGRSLRIGEQYARMLLRAKAKDGDHAKADRIAEQLVYGYTHHPFPIDYYEAERIGLDVTHMDGRTYGRSIDVVKACNNKNFVTFLSKEQDKRVKASKTAERLESSVPAQPVAGAGADRAQADLARSTAYSPPESRKHR